MNKIVLVFILICNFSFSQKITLNEVDEFNDIRKIYSDAIKGKYVKNSDDVASGLFKTLFVSTKYLGLENTSTLLLCLTTNITGTQCLTKNSDVILILDNSEKLIFKHIDKIECQSNSITGFFKIDGNIEYQKSILKDLSENSIVKLRISYSEAHDDIEILEEKKQIIKDHFKLLLEEIEKL